MTSKIHLKMCVEHRRDAFGIGTNRPRLSWIAETNLQNWHQAGYEIEASDANGQLIQQTRCIESGQSVMRKEIPSAWI